MTLHMRPKGTEAVPYAPARDLVYLLPAILQNAAERLQEARFPTLHKWLNENDVTPEELGEVCNVFVELMSTAVDNPGVTVQTALEAAGWFKLRDEARIAFMFYIGAQLLGVMWQGVRDTSVISDEVLLDVRRLAGLGDKVQQALSQPRWRRWLTRLGIRLRTWLIRSLPGSN